MNKSVIVMIVIASLALVMLVMWLVLRFKYPSDPSATSGRLEGSSRDEELSNIILNTVEDGILLVDAQKQIRLFNPAASTITGWPIQQALRRNCDEVIKLVDVQGQPYGDAQNPFSRVFAATSPIRDYSAVLETRSGKHVPIALSLSPLIDNQGKTISGAVAILRDASQERVDQQQRTEFVSIASHEMRTPVAAIQGYLALALNDHVATVDSRAREYLEKAYASARYLGKLFQALLTSANAEDGRLPNRPLVIDLTAFLEHLTEELRLAADKKGLSTEFLLGSEDVTDADHDEVVQKVIKPLYYVFADPDRIREVITNLLDNAVKYTEHGRITVGLTGDRETVKLFVRDTGAGIPRDDIPHLFQKFYRVNSSSTQAVGGTGLGLFICREIVQLYDGRIWVESELGQGSTFYINLPRLTARRAAQLQAVEASSGRIDRPSPLA